MLDINKITERIKLRQQILVELYELFYSDKTPREEALIGKKKDLFTNIERQKAFHYLLTKKLIYTSSVTPNAQSSDDEVLAIFITAEGIDYIENVVLSQQLNSV